MYATLECVFMPQQLTAEAGGDSASHPRMALPFVIRALAAALVGALLVALLAQIPVTHAVDIGGYDAAYTRGFYDPERASASRNPGYLAGSNGAARWSRAESYLLFPQAALPADVTLRLRGWRADAAPPVITIGVAGGASTTIATSGEWQDVRLTIDGGWWKPEDVLITIAAPVAPIDPDDPRRVGILLDQAVYRTASPPLWPYPAQLAWGALAGALLYLALLTLPAPTQEQPSTRFARWSPRRAWILGMALLAITYLFLYRFQPPYPYPLRGMLPVVCAALGALTALRHGPALAARLPALADISALCGIAIWLGAALLTAQAHITLSTPGVEKDFRVFATRAVDLDLVLRADGFYNLGYPLLLWLVAPFTDHNQFLAARAIAALAGALTLATGWLLARRLLGRGAALLALLALGLNPFMAQYALYVGSDMPFAALCALTLTLLIGGPASAPRRWVYVAAGLTAGAAFLVRHPGILLLPFGIVAILAQRATSHGQSAPAGARRAAFESGLFALAFLLAIAPQLIVNARDTGDPLYSQQAKNVWLAVYVDSDWGRWNEVGNNIALSQVIADDPGRFAAAWWTNLRAFLGTGAEDTTEFGRATQLRLLTFPANWLAILGLALWLTLAVVRRNDRAPSVSRSYYLLAGWVALYAASLSVGLPLQRFVLPLTPIYALAAAWIIWQAARLMAERLSVAPARLAILAGVVLLAFLQDSFTIGARYVLDRQPAEEVAIIRLVEQRLPVGEPFGIALAPGDAVGKYSAIAHRVAPAETTPRYLLHHLAAGAPPAGETLVTAGSYTLLRIKP